MTTKIESRLYDDIDEIRKLSKQALWDQATGKPVEARDALKEINEIAESWEDP